MCQTNIYISIDKKKEKKTADGIANRKYFMKYNNYDK